MSHTVEHMAACGCTVQALFEGINSEVRYGLFCTSGLPNRKAQVAQARRCVLGRGPETLRER